MCVPNHEHVEMKNSRAAEWVISAGAYCKPDHLRLIPRTQVGEEN